MVLFDADYPYPKVYSDFCYQKSIQAILSGGLLEIGDLVAYGYYSIIQSVFPAQCLYFGTEKLKVKMEFLLNLFLLVHSLSQQAFAYLPLKELR